MIISNVRLESQGDHVVLAADCNIRHFGIDKAYFRFDKKYKDFIAADASPFAAAFLVPSMKLGQDLHIKGSMSEQLYKGLHEIMNVMISWNIGLKPIAIIVDRLEKDTFTPTHNASFFSAGVDSFYTYLKHKKSGDKKIEYFILADGYDITLTNKKLWAATCETIDEVARKENVEVIKIESNVRNLMEPIVPWGFTFGGCLAALGLSLRKQLKNVFIPSAVMEDQLCPWGSHPHIDHLRGTETLFFHHDGLEVNRCGKVQFIAQDPTVLESLRVCYRNEKNKFNCGACDKCVRTMISLYVAGTLEKSTTFPHTIDLALVKSLKIGAGGHGIAFHKENLDALEKLNLDPPLQEAIKEALRNTAPSESRVMNIAKKVWFFDYLYNRGRLYSAVIFGRRIYHDLL